MKLVKNLLLATAAALLWGQAQAWTVTATSENFSQTAYNNETPQQAETEALRECNEKSLNCKLLGEAERGVAVVLAEGDLSWFRVTNINPRIARKSALVNCKKRDKNCRLVLAVWDSGATWSAVARGSSKFFTFTNSETQAQAELGALTGCEKNTTKAGSCKIASDFPSTNQRVFYSHASSTNFTYVAQSDSATKASHGAMKGCENGKAPSESCAITTVVENHGPKVEPASMKQLVAEIERARSKVSSAPSKRTAQGTQL